MRIQMCQWFNQMMEDDEKWVKNIWFLDEAHFHLDNEVNSPNFRFSPKGHAI